jgi:hypothetical protein
MFSGQLAIEAMIQMLARFKESPEKRLIFKILTYVYTSPMLSGFFADI